MKKFIVHTVSLMQSIEKNSLRKKKKSLEKKDQEKRRPRKASLELEASLAEEHIIISVRYCTPIVAR